MFYSAWLNLHLKSLTLLSPPASGPWCYPGIHWQCWRRCHSRIWRCLWSCPGSPAPPPRPASAYGSFQHLRKTGQRCQRVAHFIRRTLHIFHHWFILFWISWSENVLTESEEGNQDSYDQQLIHGVTRICEERKSETLKAYLTLSTRVRHCHTFLHLCAADRFVLISKMSIYEGSFNLLA